MIRTVSALVLALVLAAVLTAVIAVPGLAVDAPTSSLTAGPPAGAWTAYPAETGPRTAADIYGSSAASVSGFADAYRRTWTRPDEVLVDRVERFTSVIWASVRFSQSRDAAAKNRSHSSYATLPSLTPMAYETKDPADAQGFFADTIVFSKGDYVAVVELADKGSVPREVLLDQARRQLDLLPFATAEYSAIGSGVLIGGGVLLVVVVAVIVAVILLVRRRRTPAVAVAQPAAAVPQQAVSPSPPVAAAQLSPDGRFWWNGQAWQDTESSIPPGSPRSPDGGHWWDGARWRPVPPGR